MISSMGGTQGAVNFSTYNAGKAFEWILTESLWTELADRGVDAVNVFVGATSSANYNSFKETLDPELCDRTDTDDPLDRAGSRLMRPEHTRGSGHRVLRRARQTGLSPTPIPTTSSSRAAARPAAQRGHAGLAGAAGNVHASSRSRRPGEPAAAGRPVDDRQDRQCRGQGHGRSSGARSRWLLCLSADKVGRDVGELCGIGPLGITATDDVEALLALEPDCVSYMAYRPNFDHLERILESGANVVTTMYMMAGTGYGEVATHRLRDACLRGGSRSTRPASTPATRRWWRWPPAPCAAASTGSRSSSRSTSSGYANEQMFRAQGFDLEPGRPGRAGVSRPPAARSRIRSRCWRGARLDIDEVGFQVEFAAADQDTDFGFMTLGKGRIAGFKGTVSGNRRPLADRVQLRLEAR